MRKRSLAVVALGALLGAASPLAAQNAAPPSGAQATSPASGAPDFLFGQPRGSLTVRGAWLFARAGSDLYDFVQRHLTVDKSDFNAPMIGVDGSVAITSRVDIAFGLELARTKTGSEYRDYVDNLNLPINQETSLNQTNLSGSVRFNLVPRGRSVSRYAWVPRSVTPFVGAGGGMLWYKFEQSGDFVDFVDLSVFPDYFSSSGFTPSVHVFGGADIHLYRILFLTTEGRYVWAHATLGQDFVDFDPIDLAGFRLSTGISVMF
jgi:hypothetical protein